MKRICYFGLLVPAALALTACASSQADLSAETSGRTLEGPSFDDYVGGAEFTCDNALYGKVALSVGPGAAGVYPFTVKAARGTVSESFVMAEDGSVTQQPSAKPRRFFLTDDGVLQITGPGLTPGVCVKA